MSLPEDPASNPDTPTPPSESGFQAPEILVSGMLLGFVGLGLLLLVMKGTGIDWTWEYWGSSDGTFDRSVVFRNFGLLALALIALPLAVWRSWTAHKQAETANKQHKLSEKGLIIDRFQKGAQMLESDELSVRFAGIYALRELAQNDPNETYIMVQDLLCDFIRERSKLRQPNLSKVTKTNPNADYGAPPPDLQKALETMTRLRSRVPISARLEQHANWRMDLRQTNLSGADMSGASLSGAYLRQANISCATLNGANLSGADLFKANLRNADLKNANLNGAQFGKANMARSKLAGANLTDASLDSANLKRAHFQFANLQNASLHRTILNNAFFTEANLIGAFLFKADLSNAYLTAANLTGTNLQEAKLKFADLTCANLSNAKMVGVDLLATNVNLAWTYEKSPAIDILKGRVVVRAARKEREGWIDFVDRIIRDYPTLEWSPEFKEHVNRWNK